MTDAKTTDPDVQAVRGMEAYEAYLKSLPEVARKGYITEWKHVPEHSRNAWIKMVNDVYEQGRVDEQFSTE